MILLITLVQHEKLRVLRIQVRGELPVPHQAQLMNLSSHQNVLCLRINQQMHLVRHLLVFLFKSKIIWRAVFFPTPGNFTKTSHLHAQSLERPVLFDQKLKLQELLLAQCQTRLTTL